ncbi:HTH-type transcriptional regulator/antitoxin HipB [Paenibacillus sp. LBL]|uniref:helix-turn-helix domain-containing protein n=1 Tax=Paenibacillus sp. LBL TaxID=2940563 RepID=UPI002476A63C|nr:XRE family transcriptional regulator [Paenibacillus sp. LBL]MDH6674327.1 HTH-type transcriptional regulator/antitoxin HipB [Paenibacillus sp. LBL]
MEKHTLEEQKASIAAVINLTREDADISIRKLAKMTGFSPTQISRVLNGTNYTIDTLLKTLNSLGLGLEITILQTTEKDNGTY